MAHKILLIDPEPAARSDFERTLKQEGFQVLTGTSGREALRVATKEILDLMIVDLHLADVQTHELCKIIRETPQSRCVPILTISLDDPKGMAVQCLNNGADGHLTKQLATAEFIAHIRALLRRPPVYLSAQDIIERGSMTLRLGERRAMFRGKDIEDLTPKEYELLKELLIRSPRIVEKHALAMKIWGISYDQLGRKTLDVHIQRLRRKLGQPAATYLKTVSLAGYQWIDTPETLRLTEKH